MTDQRTADPPLTLTWEQEVVLFDDPPWWLDEYRACGCGNCGVCGAGIVNVRDVSAVEHESWCFAGVIGPYIAALRTQLEQAQLTIDVQQLTINQARERETALEKADELYRRHMAQNWLDRNVRVDAAAKAYWKVRDSMVQDEVARALSGEQANGCGICGQRKEAHDSPLIHGYVTRAEMEVEANG